MADPCDTLCLPASRCLQAVADPPCSCGRGQTLIRHKNNTGKNSTIKKISLGIRADLDVAFVDRVLLPRPLGQSLISLARSDGHIPLRSYGRRQVAAKSERDSEKNATTNKTLPHSCSRALLQRTVARCCSLSSRGR